MKIIPYKFNDSLVNVSLSDTFISHMKREIIVHHISHINRLKEIDKSTEYKEFFKKCKKADCRHGEVHYVSGKIIEVQRERTTQMTQNVEAHSTATTSAYAHMTSSNNVSCSVSSTLKTKVNIENTSYDQQYQDIFIQDDTTGIEYHFKLIDSDIVFRTGNTATFAWLDICENDINHSPFFLIKNHDTGKEFYQEPLDLYVINDGKADLVGYLGLIFIASLLIIFRKELIFSTDNLWLFARSLFLGSIPSSVLTIGMKENPKKRTIYYYALLVIGSALCFAFSSIWTNMFPVMNTGTVMHSIAFIIIALGMLLFFGHLIVAFSPEHDAKVKEEALKARERKREREEWARKIWEDIMNELRTQPK